MPLSDESRKIIFEKLRKNLESCCPPMVLKSSSDKGCEVIGNKAVPYGYKKEIIPGMFFAAAVPRDGMVSFYFFPCYTSPGTFNKIAPVLFKTLKGKTCFNLKKEEQVIDKELSALLKEGILAWKKAGYMK